MAMHVNTVDSTGATLQNMRRATSRLCLAEHAVCNQWHRWQISGSRRCRQQVTPVHWVNTVQNPCRNYSDSKAMNTHTHPHVGMRGTKEGRQGGRRSNPINHSQPKRRSKQASLTGVNKKRREDTDKAAANNTKEFSSTTVTNLTRLIGQWRGSPCQPWGCPQTASWLSKVCTGCVQAIRGETLPHPMKQCRCALNEAP